MMRSPLLPPPRVSIAMPVYNGGRYFELALQSALAQTYPDIEIVIVNDGSTDGGATDEIAARYEAQHPGRVIYLRQGNTGVSGALNAAIRRMTGDIFCWLSHDDLFVPGKTAVQADVWRRIGRRDAILFSDYGVIGPEGDLIVAGAFEHALFTKAPRLPLYRGGVNGCTVFIPAHLLRKRPEPFDEGLRFAGDYKLWLELLRDHEFLHVPQSLVLSRRHPGQDSRRPDIAAEGEALWRGMVDGMTEVQMAQLYGSAWRFFDETHRILSRSPYQDTAAYLARRRDTYLSDALVTVFLHSTGQDGAARTLQGVLGQSHPSLEVIVVGPEPAEFGGLLEDRRVRFLPGPSEYDRACEFAVEHARGAYFVGVRPGVLWEPDYLSAHLAQSAETGARNPPLLHRSLLAQGYGC